MQEKRIIGRRDKADLPAIDIKNVDVKIDSGAYSCSIHCELIQEVELDGKSRLEVVFLDSDHKKFTGKVHVFDSFRKKNVKSSTGFQQERYFVRLSIELFGQAFETDFSLTKRNGLRNPILLGRKLLSSNFIIDTTLVNQSFKQKKAKKKS
jgi:hypothetical protein